MRVLTVTQRTGIIFPVVFVAYYCWWRLWFWNSALYNPSYKSIKQHRQLLPPSPTARQILRLTVYSTISLLQVYSCCSLTTFPLLYSVFTAVAAFTACARVSSPENELFLHLYFLTALRFGNRPLRPWA